MEYIPGMQEEHEVISTTMTPSNRKTKPSQGRRGVKHKYKPAAALSYYVSMLKEAFPDQDWVIIPEQRDPDTAKIMSEMCR